MTQALFLTLVLTLAVASALHPADEPTAALKAILDEAWEFQLREEPLFATRVGDRRYNDRLPAVAPGDFGRRAAFARQHPGSPRRRSIARALSPKPTASTTTCSGAPGRRPRRDRASGPGGCR